MRMVRRRGKALADDAIALCELTELFQRRVIGVGLDLCGQLHVDYSDRHLAGETERAARIERAGRPDPNRRQRQPHGRRDAAHRHPGAGDQRFEEHVAGAGVIAFTTRGRVQTGAYRTRPARNRAGDSGIRKASLAVQWSEGGRRILLVPLLQRSLHRTQSCRIGSVHALALSDVIGQICWYEPPSVNHVPRHQLGSEQEAK